MSKFIYVLIGSLFLISVGPAQYIPIPSVMRFMVDCLAMAAVIAIVLRLALFHNIQLSSKYAYLILIFLIVAFAGVMLNSVRVEPLISGMRFHLKYLPFFLLPAVFRISDEQLKRYLLVIFVFCLIQLPTIVLQRFFLFKGAHPDFFGGTVTNTNHVSLILLVALAVLFAFYLNRQITTSRFLFFAFWLFLGTTLNETKATIAYFPMALAFPAYFVPRVWGSSRMKNICTVGIVGLVFIATFAIIFQKTEGYDILAAYQQQLQDRGEGYLYYGERAVPGERYGRVDVIVAAIRYLSKGLAESSFGVGMGNAYQTRSALAAGDYASERAAYTAGHFAVTHILWELGFAGLFSYLLFFPMLFWDALYLRSSGGLIGTIALGWTAVIPMLGLSLVHTNILVFNALNVLFWFFSGVIATKAFELRSANRIYACYRDHVNSFRETVPCECK